MEVRHMLVVGERLIRSLVGWHCRPAGAPAGIAVEEHSGILDEAHLSIPAPGCSDTPALARSDIVGEGCSYIVAEGHSCILGWAHFYTALEERCCTPWTRSQM